MLKDEFKRLMELFREGASGKKIDLPKVFAESLAFFEHLKKEFETGSPEERKEVVQMMGAMHKEIMEESKKILKTSGMSEEQLLAFSENPANFDPEQWKELQESKAEIHKAGMELVKLVKKLLPSPEHKEHRVQEIKEQVPKKGRQMGKSSWMRS